MVFLSDHGHVVTTEKVRNMRACRPRSTMLQEKPESEPNLFYGARGWGLDRQNRRLPAPQFFAAKPNSQLWTEIPRTKRFGRQRNAATWQQRNKKNLENLKLTEVSKGSGATFGRGVTILNTGHHQELLGNGSGDDSGTTGCRNETHPNGAAFSYRLI